MKVSDQLGMVALPCESSVSYRSYLKYAGQKILYMSVFHSEQTPFPFPHYICDFYFRFGPLSVCFETNCSKANYFSTELHALFLRKIYLLNISSINLIVQLCICLRITGIHRQMLKPIIVVFKGNGCLLDTSGQH
jgi:hypothetical protein